MKQKNDWKRLNAELNAHAASGSLKISHTTLFPVHSVGRGPNPGEPALLEFGTRLIQANGIHFHYESKYNSVLVYIASITEGYPDNTFFEVRRDGKNSTFKFHKGGQHDNWFMNQLRVVARLKGAEGHSIYYVEDVRAALESQGYSVLTEFAYTHEIRYELPHHGGGSHIHPEYVKPVRNGIEIGWISRGTYNSLPHVLKVEKITEIKTVALRDLGLETTGNHSHHYQCTVLPEQADAAKAFFSQRFKARAL